MKKPDSLVQLVGFIFAIIGATFIGAGYLNKAGILGTSPHSKGDPAVVFPILGTAFLVAGVIFFFTSLYIWEKRRVLKSTGIRIQGTVTKIKLLPYVHFGNKNPYIIYFSYDCSGDKYEGRSHLLWDKPEVSEGDTIVVYIDQYKKHQYYAEVQ